MKKVIAILSCVAIILTLNTGTCFADVTTKTGTSGQNTVPAFLNLEATAIDFNISENIQLSGNANTVNLTCSKLVVVNNLNAGAIQVTSVTATGNSELGWSIVSFGNDFAALPLNAKKLGLKCKGVDLFDAAYGPTAAINSGKTLEIEFEAKTCVTSEKLTDVNVANVVATVKMYDVNSVLPETKE